MFFSSLLPCCCMTQCNPFATILHEDAFLDLCDRDSICVGQHTAFLSFIVLYFPTYDLTEAWSLELHEAGEFYGDKKAFAILLMMIKLLSS